MEMCIHIHSYLQVEGNVTMPKSDLICGNKVKSYQWGWGVEFESSFNIVKRDRYN